MSRIGIIGTGSMGSMLTRKFIESGKVSPGDVFIYNRTPEKMNDLVNNYGAIGCAGNGEVAARSDIIFLCVGPAEVKDVLPEIRPFLDEKKIVVSIASDVSLKKLSELSGVNVVRIIPSITSEYGAGVSVLVFGEGVPESAREEILSLFGSISRPYVTTEDRISLLSDLTSSSPAIMASIMQQYALAAVWRGGISEEDAEFLVRETFIGTAKLLSGMDYDFSSLISGVATEGGITAEGLDVIEKEIPEVFDNVLSRMSEKHLRVEKSSR
ncbi:pyrroline-5-carboxylate reductase family protein [Methanolacinia paynteri]|uniref:pyrroline-5-carboxylate reductase family protein n=1 Tax=Methanolacinia paynteri TaxID=230356 RepID=UPI00064E4BAA|nr:NAD(P)-binding domain-containing protein [Methanolacinia paynteri]